MMFYPSPCITLGVHLAWPNGQMRLDLSLPRVVCEYKDVFSDELPGLPP